ncbi:hypothetical protein GCM10007159_24470 [Modicisalibacter luteus]|nr:hypothetical protein GCM10007159_24470 [Halomonas lutea]
MSDPGGRCAALAKVAKILSEVPAMSNRYEDLSLDELRVLHDELGDEIDLFGTESASDDLLEKEHQVGREISRREADEVRRVGGYAAELVVVEDGQAVDRFEYALKAENQEDAEAEARSGAGSMASITGHDVRVEAIKGPLVD